MFLKILGQTGECMYADQITLFGRPYTEKKTTKTIDFIHLALKN